MRRTRLARAHCTVPPRTARSTPALSLQRCLKLVRRSTASTVTGRRHCIARRRRTIWTPWLPCWRAALTRTRTTSRYALRAKARVVVLQRWPAVTVSCSQGRSVARVAQEYGASRHIQLILSGREPLHNPEQHAAAAKIQAVFRGYTLRKVVLSFDFHCCAPLALHVGVFDISQVSRMREVPAAHLSGE